jgi:hypothetical protein
MIYQFLKRHIYYVCYLTMHMSKNLISVHILLRFLSEMHRKLPIFKHAVIDKRFYFQMLYTIKGSNLHPFSFTGYKIPSFSLFERHV